MSTPRAVQDVTGVDKSAIERLLLLADFSITLNGVYNNAAGKSHAVFKTVPSLACCALSGITINTTSLRTSAFSRITHSRARPVVNSHGRRLACSPTAPFRLGQ